MRDGIGVPAMIPSEPSELCVSGSTMVSSVDDGSWDSSGTAADRVERTSLRGESGVISGSGVGSGSSSGSRT